LRENTDELIKHSRFFHSECAKKFRKTTMGWKA